MKIVSWNVNSVKARLPHVIQYLQDYSPDVVLLQELKCVDEAFPTEPISDLGYSVATFGQKTYNGVAILSRVGLEDVVTGNEFFEDSQARVIEAVVDGSVRVMSVYAPNGQAIGSDKYEYKLAFYKGLQQLVQDRLTFGEMFIIGGDFNVAPSNYDVYDPAAFQDDILCSPQERMAFRSLLNLGLMDALRETNPDTQGLYTWWDYRKGAFVKNHGLRIDHMLLSSAASQAIKGAGVDTEPRSWERPSDHAPVWVEI